MTFHLFFDNLFIVFWKESFLIKFDVDKTVRYWYEGADYDMEVAEAMYEKRKYPYALFMEHLALAKLLKAL